MNRKSIGNAVSMNYGNAIERIHIKADNFFLFVSHGVSTIELGRIWRAAVAPPYLLLLSDFCRRV